VLLPRRRKEKNLEKVDEDLKKKKKRGDDEK
jgi:hypothetical protein